MVTMGDVAAQAGVSQATVSFVLGGRADRLKISHQTRERVLKSARELGYQRNQLARAMVTGKSRILGVLTTPNTGENMVRILTGAMEAASENNYLLKVVHLSYTSVEDAAISRCLEWRVAGAMVVGLSQEVHIHLNEAFQQAKIPVTLIDNVPPVNWGVRIGSDDDAGIRSVVSHLLALGHRRIAFIGGLPGSLSRWREESFRAALGEAGLSAPPHWVRHSSWGDPRVIEEEVRELFAQSGDTLPTAVVCSADAIAMVVIRTARAMGMRLPDDLSVTGYSNANLAAFADPPLTTVDQSFLEMGRAAALQLIGIAEQSESGEDHEAREVLIATRFIERASTAVPPSA